MKLSVSLLSSNYDIKKTIDKINATDAEYFHIDVMDGIFVPKYYDELSQLKGLKKESQVHLMVNDPFKYITLYSELKPRTIIFQMEVDEDIISLLNYIKSLGIRAGLAIKPETDINEISEYLNIVDEVLIMTVEPGQGGQKFMEEMTEKIEMLSNIKEKRGLNFEIGVDGGINSETIKKLSGVDIAAVGSYICKNENYQKQIDNLRL